ncbi:hypothetical protein ADUPG1_007379, partial [Aduncisulcus paluster]
MKFRLTDEIRLCSQAFQRYDIIREFDFVPRKYQTHDLVARCMRPYVKHTILAAHCPLAEPVRKRDAGKRRRKQREQKELEKRAHRDSEKMSEYCEYFVDKPSKKKGGKRKPKVPAEPKCKPPLSDAKKDRSSPPSSSSSSPSPVTGISSTSKLPSHEYDFTPMQIFVKLLYEHVSDSKLNECQHHVRKEILTLDIRDIPASRKLNLSKPLRSTVLHRKYRLSDDLRRSLYEIVIADGKDEQEREKNRHRMLQRLLKMDRLQYEFPEVFRFLTETNSAVIKRLEHLHDSMDLDAERSHRSHARAEAIKAEQRASHVHSSWAARSGSNPSELGDVVPDMPWKDTRPSAASSSLQAGARRGRNRYERRAFK